MDSLHRGLCCRAAPVPIFHCIEIWFHHQCLLNLIWHFVIAWPTRQDVADLAAKAWIFGSSPIKVLFTCITHPPCTIQIFEPSSNDFFCQVWQSDKALPWKGVLRPNNKSEKTKAPISEAMPARRCEIWVRQWGDYVRCHSWAMVLKKRQLFSEKGLLPWSTWLHYISLISVSNQYLSLETRG